MTARASFSVKGLEEYLERIAKSGRDVDAAAGKAVAAGGDVILQGMEAHAPVLTGKLKITLARTPVQQEGNFVFVEVGMPSDADADVARYGNVQEYGSTSMPAHPYIRPGFDQNKRKALKAERKVLEQEGYPVTIYEKVKAALDTLTPVPYGQGTFLATGALPDQYLVYQLISGVPEQHADNAETERTYRVQVSIYDRSGLAAIPNVNAAMLAQGFTLGPERDLPRDQDTGHYGLAKDFFYLMEA